MFLRKSVSKNGKLYQSSNLETVKCKETSKLKTETFLLLKETFIWSKIYRVVNHSVNMGVVEV